MLFHDPRRHLLRGERPFERPRSACPLSDAIDTAQQRDDAKRLFRMAEARGRAGENHVGAHRQFETAAKTAALHDSDGWHCQPLELVEHRHIALEQRPQLGDARIRPRHDVATEAEVWTVGAQEQSARGTLADDVEPVGEFVQHLCAETVLRWVVQYYGREIVFNGVTQMSHTLFPLT